VKLLLFLALCSAAAAADTNRLTTQEKKEGYTLLFNGKNLDGWDGDPTLWSVQDGAIVGLSDGHPFKVNTFLIYKKRNYANFILKASIKLRNHNSGIQFRSEQLPGPGWIVRGLQADASDVGDKSAWGNYYEERGRSRTMMKTPDEGWLKAKSVLRKQDWNTYEILADGEHIRLTFNGVVTIDTEEKQSRDGIIALQLHAGEPMRVEFRDVKMKLLR
jgi:3-keto-disaccharide hydrolase